MDKAGTAGRDILEDINTSSARRRNACSCQIKQALNARPGREEGLMEKSKTRAHKCRGEIDIAKAVI